jgi:two-component sensor histidine kinase
MTAISYTLLHYKNKIALASNIIVTIAIIPLYILIYFNHFGNMVIIYVIFLPLAAFFLLEFKKAILVNFFMYILLISMLYHISTINPDAPILNNPLALINIAFASILILFFGVFYHLAIDSSIAELIRSNRQKDILLKEVHHRVKNNLNVIASIIGLQSLHKSQETQTELIHTKSRIESIAIVHEMLYQQSDYEEIIFNDYVDKLTRLILSMNSTKVTTSIKIIPNENITLHLNIMIQVGLIINEMATNSLKYAANKEGLNIYISLKNIDETYLLSYWDNGANELTQEDIESSKGLGFKLIHLSVKQLDGEISTYYNSGLHYEIGFKND